MAWFVFIAAALALPASTVGVHEGRFFQCPHGCLVSALSKWISRQIKKSGLAPQSAIAKIQSANIKSRALAVTDAQLNR